MPCCQSLFNRILLFLFGILYFTHLSFGQKPKLKSTSWRDNWKVDVSAGSGVLLSKVPEKYLDRINNVNIPIKVPGSAGILSIRKGLNSHFEMGYQLDYLRINGKVKQGENTFTVLTQAYGNSFLVLYNLKRTDEFRPRYNYYLYYKIGGVSLKNYPEQIRQDDSPVPEGESSDEKEFIKNVAVITGLGIGVNHQLTSNFSLKGTIEMNRSSDAADEVYKIHKIFYRSENTVNNYSSITVGLCYSFNFSKSKKSSFFNPRNATDRRLIQNRIIQEKGKQASSRKLIWYN